MIACSYCKQGNDEKAFACSHCGGSLAQALPVAPSAPPSNAPAKVATVTCKNCNKREIPATANFCPNCRERMKQDKPKTPTQRIAKGCLPKLTGCLSYLLVPLGGLMVLFLTYVTDIYISPLYGNLWERVWNWRIWQQWEWPIPWDFFEFPLRLGLRVVVGIPMLLPPVGFFGAIALGIVMFLYPLRLLMFDLKGPLDQ